MIEDSLKILKSIRVITGALSIDINAAQAADFPSNFSFLENLEYIHGRRLFDGYALKLSNTGQRISVCFGAE